MTADPFEAAALIAVDWGTSRCRALLLDKAGAILAEADSAAGIAALGGQGHEAAFDNLVAGWPDCPAIMAGMIGSRQGWREAAYVEVPTALDALAAGLQRFETSRHRPVAIVPGLCAAFAGARRRRDPRRGDPARRPDGAGA